MHVYAHVEKCSRVTQNLVQIRCSARSVTVHAAATQYTCSLSGVCRPTDQYREVAGVHAHAFRSTRLSGQVSSRLHKPFSLY